MKHLWQPATLHQSLRPPLYLSPLKPPKNHLFLTQFRNSSTDSIPQKINCTTTTHRREPPPADWINFVGPNQAMVVERHGKYWKTLRTGIHFLDPMVDKIAGVHSLKEQVIIIPLETVTRGRFEIVIEGQLFIKVVDPYLASYGHKDVDVISAVTQLVETTLPLRRMIEEIVFMPEFIDLKDMYDLGCRCYEADRDPDFRIFDDFGSFYEDFFKHPGFEIDDGINKITADWGVECLYIKIHFYMPKEEMPNWRALEEFRVYYTYRGRSPHTSKRIDKLIKKWNEEAIYKLLRRKGDRIMRSVEILRDYFKRGGKDVDSKQYMKVTKRIPKVIPKK